MKIVVGSFAGAYGVRLGVNVQIEVRFYISEFFARNKSDTIHISIRYLQPTSFSDISLQHKYRTA
jgi:hypothetical protein